MHASSQSRQEHQHYVDQFYGGYSQQQLLQPQQRQPSSIYDLRKKHGVTITPISSSYADPPGSPSAALDLSIPWSVQAPPSPG